MAITATSRRWLTDQRVRCEGVIGYVANNRTGIRNYRIVPLALSGPMEKGVDIAICRRLKTRGMSWFRRGVRHLLHLKLLRLSGNVSQGCTGCLDQISDDNTIPVYPLAGEQPSTGRPRPASRSIMRSPVLWSVTLGAVVLVAAAAATPASAGEPLDLPNLRIEYGYGPALDGRGFWMGTPTGGEWRITGGRFGDARRLTLDVEIRPPAITVPLEPGPAVLFGTMELDGGYGGDAGATAPIGRVAAQVLPACPDASDCTYSGSITLDTRVLPRIAARYPEASWGSVSIGLSLVRTFAQGTWLQVLPLYDEMREEADGTIGRPLPVTSRMLTTGAFPVAQQLPWNRIDRAILARVERLRRSVDDPSGMPITVPLLVDIRASACTPGWTIATVTGDTLINIREEGTSVPMRVEVPVGAAWIASVPSLDRAQGTGDPARAFGPYLVAGPAHVGGWVSGDHYLCEGHVGGELTWRAAGAEEIAAFPGFVRCVQADRSGTVGRPGSIGRCLS